MNLFTTLWSSVGSSQMFFVYPEPENSAKKSRDAKRTKVPGEQPSESCPEGHHTVALEDVHQAVPFSKSLQASAYCLPYMVCSQDAKLFLL